MGSAEARAFRHLTASYSSSVVASKVYTMESDLVVEPAGHLPWLWGTTFLLAMVFSCFWLIKAFISGQPKLAYHLGKVSSTVKLAIPCSISGLSRSCSRSKPPPGQHVSKAQDIGWSSTAAAAKQVQPVVFEWCDMGCSVSVAGNNKTILQASVEDGTA